MTTIPTLRSIVRAVRAPLLAYAITLAASLVLMGLVVVALAVGSDSGNSDDPGSDVDIQAIGNLIGMPFQLAAMALGGTIRLGAADGGVTLFAPPLLLTALFFTAVFRLSRRDERSTASASTSERAVLATASALVVAVIATIATRSLAMRDDGLVMHAATVGLFFGTFALAGTAGFLGRQAVTQSLWPRVLGADGRRALHLVAQQMLVWLMITTPIIVVWVLVETNLQAAVFAAVWVPTASLWAFALGHAGALTAFGHQEFAWDLGWVSGVVLPVLVVGLALATAIAWHLRRGNDRELLSLPVSWITLPVTYGLVGVVVPLISTVVMGGDLFGGSLSIAFHPAYWLIPVLFVWGAAVEALSRYVAPALVGVVPASVAGRLARGPVSLVSPEQPPTQRIPMSPADRARARKGIVGVGALAVVLLAAFIAVRIVSATAFSPEHEARAYLDAIVEGDVAKAIELAPVGKDASSDLLDDEVYAAAHDRITGYDISKVETHGSSATVTMNLRGPHEGRSVELTLSSHGNTGVFFHHWKIDDGGLARAVTVDIPESSSSLEANGVAVPVTGGDSADFWLFPGSYAFNPYGDSQWLRANGDRTDVPASDSYGIYAETSDPEPSDQLKKLVDSKLNDWVTECMKVTTTEPTGCPQSTYAYGDKPRKVRWKLVTMPTISWGNFDGTFPTDLSSDVTGEASVTYEYDDSYGFGAPHWVKESDTSDLYVNAKVDLVGDQPQVTFDSY